MWSPWTQLDGASHCACLVRSSGDLGKTPLRICHDLRRGLSGWLNYCCYCTTNYVQHTYRS